MLARYLPSGARKLADVTAEGIFGYRDSSGRTLEDKLRQFCADLAKRRDPAARSAIMDDLEKNSKAERSGLLPNISRITGETSPEQRSRHMRGFNSPFYPEILVASSVLAEGVDLHLHCRHVIHHDLSWNPSSLEQRTGRVDRIGCLAEQVTQPIRVYSPYVAETQDEKQYRVVTDRERWFGALMGGGYAPDTLTAETAEELAARVPLPEEYARRLELDLRV
jgi:hypothetical protein